MPRAENIFPHILCFLIMHLSPMSAFLLTQVPCWSCSRSISKGVQHITHFPKVDLGGNNYFYLGHDSVCTWELPWFPTEASLCPFLYWRSVLFCSFPSLAPTVALLRVPGCSHPENMLHMNFWVRMRGSMVSKELGQVQSLFSA